MSTIIEAPLEKLKRLAELQRQAHEARKTAFASTWRCDDPHCPKGLPHGPWTQRHARGTQVLVDMPQRVFYAAGGRGSGKTWAGARNLAEKILTTDPLPGHDHSVWGVVGPSFLAAKTVCVEGESGLLGALKGYVEHWNRSEGVLILNTGAVVYVDGASDGGTRIQGKHPYGIWCDEIGLWQPWERAWRESILPSLIGPGWVLCTGTPKPSSLVKELLSEPEDQVGRLRWRTRDNLHNLSPAAVEWYERRYAGTRLGRQEMEGYLVEDQEGALWSRELLNCTRVASHEPRFWQGRKIIGLDPADGTEDGDEQGLAIVGQSTNTHELYVLESEGYRLGPWQFLQIAVDKAIEHSAMIVMERNYAGRFASTMLEQVMRDKGALVPYTTVHAKDGKRTRAEPVAGLYEQHKVHHVGHFPELEDQMTSWVGLPNMRQPSPDRLDALVYACSQFIGWRLAAPDPDGYGAAVWQDDESIRLRSAAAAAPWS